MTSRSYLFVPADRPERFGKALACGADTAIVDLEDAVTPAVKAEARRYLAEWLASAHEPGRLPVVVRINAVDTEWFHDLAACRVPGVQAIMLPNAERVDVLADVASGAETRVIALVETGFGFDNLRAIAHAPQVERIAFGSIDFQLDLGLTGDGDALLACGVAGLRPPIDGVSTSIRDADSVTADALRARRLGFGAKLCIHPAQVQAVNLTPSVRARRTSPGRVACSTLQPLSAARRWPSTER